MTDWRAAGQLADAHRVRDLARAAYGSSGKTYARSCAVRFMRTHSRGVVLDLWGGGTSADALTDTGLDVLSVEDGRWLKSGLGISGIRAKRALAQSGKEGGYRTDWGPAAKYARDCDAAFYDLCGHWCPDVRRLLQASSHMTAIAITLMPERVAIGKNLTPSEWRVAYGALLKACLHTFSMRAYRTYRRDDGQRVFVFHLLHKPYLEDEAEKRRLRNRSRSRDVRDRDNARRRTDEYRAYNLRRYHERYEGDPAFRQRMLDRARARAATDEGKAARRVKNHEAWVRLKADPVRYAAYRVHYRELQAIRQAAAPKDAARLRVRALA